MYKLMCFVLYSESMMNKMFDKSSNNESAKDNAHKSPSSLLSANTDSSNTDPIVLQGKSKMADDPIVLPGKSKWRITQMYIRVNPIWPPLQ